VITDGTYDVFVVDATPLSDETDPTSPVTGWHLELTILAGEHKGELVTLRAPTLRGIEFDLIGMPGTLAVAQGEPSFRIDA
jgi:hypothetical protein